MRQGCHFSSLLFNIVLELLARAIRQEKKIKWIHIEKKGIILSPFVDDMITYLKDLKNSTKKILDIINTFSKTVGTK
jgi:hypothetical protein